SSQKDFIFNCSVLGGNGFVTFSGGATANYVNTPAATVIATTPLGPTVQMTVDTIAPTLAFDSANPAANNAGWNNGDVTFTYSTDDNFSGVATKTPNPAVVTGEGTGLTTTATVTDKAGNAATFTTTPAVKIDRHIPVLTVAAHTPSNPSYTPGTWTNESVTVVYTCTDNLSGPITSHPVISGLPLDVAAPIIAPAGPLATKAT